MDFVIDEVTDPIHLALAKTLFTSYGIYRNLDAALGDYQKEIDELPGKYRPPEGCLLIATSAGAPSGCIAYQKLSSEICEMKRLFVLPTYQGFGLGTKLIEALLEKARAAQYVSMRLDSHPTMYAAQRLYDQFGFREIDRYNNNPIPGIRFFERTI